MVVGIEASDFKRLLSELRSALAHLDEPLLLEGHPLAHRLGFIAAAPAATRGSLLRRTLRRAIESIDPGLGAPPDAPKARAYQVLYRYAILRQSMVAIAAELDIGERQAYRDLWAALQALALVLVGESESERQAQDPQLTAGWPQVAEVRQEVERLSTRPSQEIDFAELMAGVLDSVSRLAWQKGVEIRLRATAPHLQVATNRVLLRQAMINLLSHLLHAQQAGRIDVRLSRSEKDAVAEFTYRPAPSGQEPITRPAQAAHPDDPYSVAVQLFATLGVGWTSSGPSDSRGPTGASRVGRLTVRVPLPQGRTLLVVDDNVGYIALIRGYLRGLPYRIEGLTEPSEALDAIQRLHPDVVILDVMMPNRDGWEVLEALRRGEASGQAAGACGPRVRVVVCSIIHDPELASALGADAFLGKPVDRAALLATLDGFFSTAT